MSVKDELTIAIRLCNKLIRDLDGHPDWQLSRRAKEVKAIREQLHKVEEALGVN